jgi:hypothetical protein
MCWEGAGVDTQGQWPPKDLWSRPTNLDNAEVNAKTALSRCFAPVGVLLVVAVVMGLFYPAEPTWWADSQEQTWWDDSRVGRRLLGCMYGVVVAIMFFVAAYDIEFNNSEGESMFLREWGCAPRPKLH